MKRTVVSSILIAVVLLAVGVIAEAQQTTKVPRIGYLSSSDPADESSQSEAIRRSIHEKTNSPFNHESDPAFSKTEYSAPAPLRLRSFWRAAVFAPARARKLAHWCWNRQSGKARPDMREKSSR